MIDIDIKRIAEDIKNIKIQGASNIELSAISGIIRHIQKSKTNGSEFLADVTENINILIKQRPNEPKLRNSMNYILSKAKLNQMLDNRDKLIEDIKKYEENTKKANDRIAEIASQMIAPGMKVLTHCHSTLVEMTLKKAFDKGVNFEVYCTETRPLLQGRITAENLCKYGIKTTLIVDSSVTAYMKDIDLFFTGADVVFSDGAIMNKVGTHCISIIAKEFKTPHIVLTSTHCCESDNLTRITEKIEDRSPDEVWEKEDRPEKLNIKNPAFDIVPSDLIDKFITEEGVLSPDMLFLWINRSKI